MGLENMLEEKSHSSATIKIRSLPVTVNAGIAAKLIKNQQKLFNYPLLRYLYRNKGTPSSLELLYVPHYYFEFAGSPIKKQGPGRYCVYLTDAALGIVETCPVIPQTISIEAPVKSVISPKLKAEEILPFIEPQALRFIFQRTGSLSINLVKQGLLYLPYWVVYFTLPSREIDFEAIEAFSNGMSGGRKVKDIITALIIEGVR